MEAGIGAGRRNWSAGACLLLVLLLLGCQGTAEKAHVIDAAPRDSLSRSKSSTSSGIGGENAARPVRVRVPAQSIDASIQPLDVDRSGALQPPTKNDVAGWWEAGPEPGENGPSVIAGHVDSYRGPAVFYRLSRLEAGAQIFVDRADGSTAVFTAYKIERHPKDAFPTAAVYGPTPGPELRLITCGGRFDDADGRYLANVIAFAQRTG
ncbi:class F sortase [Saccharopolyspora halophila]|uniref:Class F sortase n=1 Tax=Saccharopolyspora halophila TaxID=405551 RepID=A0ABN3GE30_9PSEU